MLSSNILSMTVTNWLSVQSEQSQCLRTLPNCLTLCDLKCDNYWKLVAVDIPTDLTQRPKMKVFKGIGMVSEQGLVGLPTAVESFYIDEAEPKNPIVAVAIAESVYLYRNMKPYFKFTTPELVVDEREIDVWRKLPVERSENQDILITSLQDIGIGLLTQRSQMLLRLPPAQRDRFIREHSDEPLKRHSVIVAMKCLPRASTGDYFPPSFLVLATECGNILILDTHGFHIVHQAKVCSYETTPSLMTVQGQFETDFRIVVASRNGAIFLLHKSWLEGKEITKLNSPPIGLTLMPIDQTIVATGMDKELICLSKKGKRLYAIELPAIPICLTPVHLPHLGITLIAVALRGGVVQFYLQRCLVEELQLEDTVSAMIFGRLGQEEYVLTMVTGTGNLHVKILKRTAEFDANKSVVVSSSGDGKSHTPASVSDGAHPAAIAIPKKSSIFVEQTERERESAQAVYSSFQVELWRLRLTAARTIFETISSSDSAISGDLAHAAIKLAAEVCGVGPQFRIFLTIENMSTRKMATNLKILLHANRNHYTIPKSLTTLPIMMPGIPLKIDFEVFAILDPVDGLPPPDLTAANSIIRVLVLADNQAKPLIAAVVAMPLSEAPL